jgi:phytoene desaturase
MKKAIVIGAGFGGISVALRLLRMGFGVKIIEKRDKPGGRAYVIEEDGFKFDCGPTILTAPYLIDELFDLFGEKRLNHLNFKSLNPYYRIYFHDQSYFDYSGDVDQQIQEIAKFSEEDSKQYLKFVSDTKKVMEKGYLELGDHPFESMMDMVRISPTLLKFDLIKNMYQYASKFFKNEKIRRVFSFHSLLIGGNPFNVSAIYALIPALEREWGVHFAMGGTGKIVNELCSLFKRHGGEILLDTSVRKIITENKIAKGIMFQDGEHLEADVVISNADFAYSHLNMIDEKDRPSFTDRKLKKKHYSMSAFVLFFGFKRNVKMDLLHHNIILSELYKELLEDIFDRKILSEDFSQYLHIPTLTDPSLAPEDSHCAYTLIPVPNLSGLIDWKDVTENFANKVIDFLDKYYIHGLKDNLVYYKTFTPLDFESELLSYLGTGWGLEPRLSQSASLRPHNRHNDIKNFYLVGASTHPGAGIPGVITTAKLTAKLIKDDYQMIEPKLEGNYAINTRQ